MDLCDRLTASTQNGLPFRHASAQSVGGFAPPAGAARDFAGAQDARGDDSGSLPPGTRGMPVPSVSPTSSFPYTVTVVTPVHLETETF